jgi:hypothetical protein
MEPLDYYMTGFDGSGTLDALKSDILEIPKRGPSVREHIVQYLLRFVEKFTEGGEVIWNIRPMTVYYSFDFSTGKAFWLSNKGNSVMQDRLKEAIADDLKFNLEPGTGLLSSFATTLMTNLIYVPF